MKEYMTMSWLPLDQCWRRMNAAITTLLRYSVADHYNTAGLHNCKFTAFVPCLFISFQPRTHTHCDTFLRGCSTAAPSGTLAAQFINALTMRRPQNHNRRGIMITIAVRRSADRRATDPISSDMLQYQRWALGSSDCNTVSFQEEFLITIRHKA